MSIDQHGENHAPVGFAAGAFAGSRIGPLVLSGGSHSPYAPLIAPCGALLLGMTFAQTGWLLSFSRRKSFGASSRTSFGNLPSGKTRGAAAKLASAMMKNVSRAKVA
jgi:hypothetical protein